RTASITGACVALVEALTDMLEKKMVSEDALLGLVGSVSVGLYKGEPVLDLDDEEDVNAEIDINVVMIQQGGFVEIQCTAEEEPFTFEQQQQMLALAQKGIRELIVKQEEVLGW